MKSKVIFISDFFITLAYFIYIIMESVKEFISSEYEYAFGSLIETIINLPATIVLFISIILLVIVFLSKKEKELCFLIACILQIVFTILAIGATKISGTKLNKSIYIILITGILGIIYYIITKLIIKKDSVKR